jgi:hypothetical protein
MVPLIGPLSVAGTQIEALLNDRSDPGSDRNIVSAVLQLEMQITG